MSDWAAIDPAKMRQLIAELEAIAQDLQYNEAQEILRIEQQAGQAVNRARAVGGIGADVHAEVPGLKARLDWIERHEPVGLRAGELVRFDERRALRADLGKEAAAQARADAQLLLAAMNDRNHVAGRLLLQEVARSLEDETGSAKYRDAFVNAAAPRLANLAGVLNGWDGNAAAVLSADDQHLLATFGRALAATVAAGRLAHPEEDFTRSPDVWSVSMLFKYGPDGSAYGTGQGAALLAGLTRSILDTRDKGQYRFPQDVAALMQSGGPQFLEFLQANDPLSALLLRDAQNKVAATEVLGGPDGARYASDLLKLPYSRYLEEMRPGGGVFLQSVAPDPNSWPYGPDVVMIHLDETLVADFLDAATQGPDPRNVPPRGTDALAREAAQAALNIIMQTPDYRNIVVSAPVRRALLVTFSRYMPDIAASIGDTSLDPNGNVLQANILGRGETGPWTLLLPGGHPSPVQTFLQQICADEGDAAKLQAEAMAAFGRAFGMQMRYGPTEVPSSDMASAFAALNGAIDAAQANVGYQGAQLADIRNAAINNLVSMAEQATLVLPVPADPLPQALWNLRFAAFPWIPQFATDNASSFAQQANSTEAFRGFMLHIAMAQGLVEAGIVKPGPDWYVNGRVVLSGSHFDDWWRSVEGLAVYRNRELRGMPSTVPTLNSLWAQYVTNIDQAYRNDIAF